MVFDLLVVVLQRFIHNHNLHGTVRWIHPCRTPRAVVAVPSSLSMNKPDKNHSIRIQNHLKIQIVHSLFIRKKN
jgi:hypothetical protein